MILPASRRKIRIQFLFCKLRNLSTPFGAANFAFCFVFIILFTSIVVMSFSCQFCLQQLIWTHMLSAVFLLDVRYCFRTLLAIFNICALSCLLVGCKALLQKEGRRLVVKAYFIPKQLCCWRFYGGIADAVLFYWFVLFSMKYRFVMYYVIQHLSNTFRIKF